MTKHKSPSCVNVYRPGSGIPLTKENIALEQRRRAEDEKKPADASEIVIAFATPYEQRGPWFQESKRFKKLVTRADMLMHGGMLDTGSPEARTQSFTPTGQRR